MALGTVGPMPFLDSAHQRAAWLIALLGVVLVIALAPYASGLLGAPILFVVVAPLHRWLVRVVRHRALASAIVLVISVVGLVLPLVWLVSLLVGQAQSAANAIVASPILDRLSALHVGGLDIGAQLKDAGTKVVSLMGGGALSLLSTATRVTLNILFTLFGLYYLLMDPGAAWRAVRPYIPFSDANVAQLRERFDAVTKSTIIGTGCSALIQGILVALALQFAGLGNAVFWGAVTVVLSILPVVGSGMVWGPAAIVLFANDRVPMAIAMVVWGLVPVANVDNFIRPYVSSRYAQIHPLITLVGAVAGVSYLGIIGLLVGPLALTYFFELLRMYQKEYLVASR